MLYVIIEGYADKDSDGNIKQIVFENCIGVTESIEKAYGIAYLTLCNAIKDSDQEGEVVTINLPTYDEEKNEFIITASDNQKGIQDYVKIFALKDGNVQDRIKRNTIRWGSKKDNNV